MHQLRLLILLLIVNFMTVAVADTTAKLRGPKEFDAPAVTRLGPLSSRDTLWRLAEQARPDPRLNMYQVMHALYLKNPDAFLEQNFNHLKPGAFLEIPTIREILATNAVEAQRKSENDDRIWAEKIRSVANAKPEEKAARQQDVAKATQEITEELSRVESQQTEQMSDIRERLGASMANVETIVVENTQLKKQLDTVVEELTLVKSKLDKDSEIQTQLQQLLLQQTELLEQQREQIRKAEEGFNFAETWQKIASSPVGWAIAASLPAIMLLLIIVSFIRRRGQQAADVVSAATAAPTVDPNYRSPLPPLDDSLDFDESSLINLDDSLLNDSLNSGIRLDDDNFAPKQSKPMMKNDFSDDLLDDSFDSPSPVSKGSSEFDLDDLLDDPLDEPVSTARTEFDPNNILSGDDLSSLFDNLEDEPAFVAKEEFDPKNILSDNDLSSLFDNLEEAEDPDDIFAQALAAQDAASAKTADEVDDIVPDQPLAADALQNAAAEADEFDELLEEIELDIPADADEIVSLDEEFDIDALMEQTQAAQNAPPAQPSNTVADAKVPDDDDFDIDSLLAANAEPLPTTADAEQPILATNLHPEDIMSEVSPEAPVSTFDSSELDAFAESLAEETLLEAQEKVLTDEEVALTAEEFAAEEFALEAEHITEAVEPDEAELASELDDILSEVAEIRAQSQLQAASLAELSLPESAVAQANEDFAEAPISIADVSSMLEDLEEDDMSIALSGSSAEVAASSASSPLTLDPDEILLDDFEPNSTASATSDVDDFSEFSSLEQVEPKTAMPDLEELDDNSVSRLYESLSSVERPSKVLDEYPDLQLIDELLTEQDADLIFPDDELTNDTAPLASGVDLDEFEEVSESLDSANKTASEQSLLAELEDLEQTNFDAMLSELDQFETSTIEPEQDLLSAKRVLAELDEAQQSQQHSEQSASDHDIPDYVHIDKLLAASEDDEQAPEQKNTLNIDVGLADFEDLISADEMGDVDHADAGYAGRLDLVRAYNEIGDAESAEQLIKEILASEAPAHVKQEALALQQS
ncbi:MAG: FimV/HubP family polar landmark protein [Rheinheimera sp.]